MFDLLPAAETLAKSLRAVHRHLRDVSRTGRGCANGAEWLPHTASPRCCTFHEPAYFDVDEAPGAMQGSVEGDGLGAVSGPLAAAPGAVFWPKCCDGERTKCYCPLLKYELQAVRLLIQERLDQHNSQK